MGITTNGLKLYLPLYSTDLQGSPITSKDSSQTSCTIVGATWGTKGRTTNGTSDYMSTPDILSSGAISILFWAKIVATDEAVNAALSNNSALVVYVRGDANHSKWGIDTSVIQQANTQPIYGTWYLFGITSAGGSSGTFYLNGIQDGTYSATDFYPTTTLYIASDRNIRFYCDGSFGEVLIYNRVLSATEIIDIYRETVKTYKACYGFATYK